MTGEESFVGGFVGLGHDFAISNCSVDSTSVISSIGDKGLGVLVGKINTSAESDKVLIYTCSILPH